MKRSLFLLLMIAFLPALTGCASMAKGVAEAVLEHKDEDKRICEIRGPAFNGVQDSVALQAEQPGVRHTKVLMVHGIGKHLPDYSARFREKLVRTLDLDSVDATIRNISLSGAAKDGQPAGLLKIWRYFSSKSNHELLFYELTWSSIDDEDKKVIDFDDSDAYSYRRASLNKSLKSFMNQTVPDLLAYEGRDQELIDKSVGQSVCWMFRSQWDDLPVNGEHYCDAHDANIAKNIMTDDFFAVTHSLGSRITIDKFNGIAEAQKKCNGCLTSAALNTAMQDSAFTVFMLANQLPLLQIGREKPANAGQTSRYCLPSGDLYRQRLIGKTRIVAFSDPNDILSYPIPDDYAGNYIDSRTCPEIVNVDINVAPTGSLFGLADFANPLEAHVGYMEDERVIRIIAAGLHREPADPLITDRCHWTESVRTETKTTTPSLTKEK